MADDKPRRNSFRPYPSEPKSERGSFMEYIEQSGANLLLINATADLFAEPNKPENPMEWLRLYFRQRSAKNSDEILETQLALKKNILKQASMLTHLKIQEHQLTVKLEELQYEAQNIPVVSVTANHDEHLKRYKDIETDARWRICPDPSIVVTKSDILVQAVENEGQRRKSRASIKGSILSTSVHGLESKTALDSDSNNEREDYKDYPKIYFGAEEKNVSPEQSLEPPLIEGLQSAEEMSESIVSEKSQIGDLTEADTESELETKSETEEKPKHGRTKTPRKSAMEGKRKRERKRTIKEIADIPNGTVSNASNNTAPFTPSSTPPDNVVPKEKEKVTSTTTIPDHSHSHTHSEHHSEHEGKSSKEHKKKEQKPKRSERSIKALEVECETEEEEEQEEVATVPIEEPFTDPLALELEPISPSYWKEDFSLTKGHENMFNFDDAIEFGIADDLEYDLGTYFSSRRELRKRKFRSQIIHETTFKPDRGSSIKYDFQFDFSDIPSLSTNASTAINTQQTTTASPSVVSAVISDDTILARNTSKPEVK